MQALGRLFDIIPAIVPVDLSTAANDGDWISMKNAQSATVVVFKGVGTAAQDPAITVEQATDVAGTSAKVLNAIDKVHSKQGVLLTAVGTWTTTTQTADEAFTVDGSSAENQALYVAEFDADELDVDNGFDCIRVRIADVGANAQIGCALVILHGLRYAGAPANLPNVIAD